MNSARNMAMTAQRVIGVGTGMILALLMTVSCTSTRICRDFLRVVFDGVPPESYYEARTNAPPDGKPLAAGQASGTVPRIEVPALVVHEPFEARQCDACHDKEVGRAIPVITNLCFKCHDDFLATMSVRHAPANAGECLRCHQPHSSRVKALLTKPQKELCGECHAAKLAPAPVMHPPFAEGSCTGCHNPHSSNRAALLSDALGKLCLRCHGDLYDIKPSKTDADTLALPPGEAMQAGEAVETQRAVAQPGPTTPVTPAVVRTGTMDNEPLQPEVPAPAITNTTARYKHAPVEAGECTSCHDPHKSATAKLLVKPVDALCFECHDKADFSGKTTHAPVEAGECTGCHDPHKSATAKLLVKPVDELCFECHDKADIDKNTKHPVPGKEPCTECHDPHRSNEPGLIRVSESKSGRRVAT